MHLGYYLEPYLAGPRPDAVDGRLSGFTSDWNRGGSRRGTDRPCNAAEPVPHCSKVGIPIRPASANL